MTPARDAVRRLRPPDTVDTGVVLGAVLLALVLLWAMQDALIDDVYITLSYARTLAEHGQWGAMPDYPANTATSVLNVLLLGLGTLVLRDPLVSLWVLTAANAAVLSIGLLRLGAAWAVGRWMACVAGPLLLLNPVLASSIGMETMLTVTALVWMLERAQRGSAAGFGWLAGVAVLLRADMALAVAVVWLLHPQLRRPRPLRAAVAVIWRAAAVCAPWFLFSWVHFGSAIPDTLALKQGQPWGSYVRGLWQRYHRFYPDAVEATVVVALLGVLSVVALLLLREVVDRALVRSVAAAPLVAGVYFAYFAFLDVPPYFWYYGLTLAGLTLPLAWVLGRLARPETVGRLAGRGPILATAVAVAAVLPVTYVWADLLRDRAPLAAAPVHGNWASPAEYKEIGLDLKERFGDQDVRIRSAGELGTIGYFCECTILDRFSTRSLIVHRLEEQSRSSPLMQLNYAWFDTSDYPPVEQDFHLVYGQRSINERLHPDMWNVYSPPKGHGHYHVAPGPKPGDVRDGVTPS